MGYDRFYFEHLRPLESQPVPDLGGVEKLVLPPNRTQGILSKPWKLCVGFFNRLVIPEKKPLGFEYPPVNPFQDVFMKFTGVLWILDSVYQISPHTMVLLYKAMRML